MSEELRIAVDLVEHLAWPVVIGGTLIYLRKDLVAILKRVKKAKIGEVEIDLAEEIEEVKNDALNMGITIAYPSSTFSKSDIEMIEHAPEWAFLQSWQKIENLLISRSIGNRRQPTVETINELANSNAIPSNLAELILKMYRLRNKIVHGGNVVLTKGEALEWLGVAKSVNDRLSQKLV